MKQYPSDSIFGQLQRIMPELTENEMRLICAMSRRHGQDLAVAAKLTDEAFDDTVESLATLGIVKLLDEESFVFTTTGKLLIKVVRQTQNLMIDSMLIMVAHKGDVSKVAN